MSDALIGASTREQDLFDHLNQHLEQEQGLLEEYIEVASKTGSKAFVYLVNLLIEDERRHHRLFAELAASLRSEAELSTADPVVPRMDLHHAQGAAVLEATATLIQREEDDARQLKKLHRELGDLKDTTLWDLLVDLMERDTQKHIAILRFAQRHAKQPVLRRKLSRP
jgi:hypothetical protein